MMWYLKIDNEVVNMNMHYLIDHILKFIIPFNLCIIIVIVSDVMKICNIPEIMVVMVFSYDMMNLYYDSWLYDSHMRERLIFIYAGADIWLSTAFRSVLRMNGGKKLEVRVTDEGRQKEDFLYHDTIMMNMILDFYYWAG